MALDLFFVARKQDFAEARAADFEASDAQIRARRKLLKAIAAHFDGAAIGGKATDGVVQAFPSGELVAHAGYLHWCLHGADDRDAIAAVVDWFFEQGYLCEDPQDAGFGNREAARGRENLSDFDALVGARLLGIELSEPFMSGLILSFILADGREAQLWFIHHVRCELPDNLTALIKDSVSEVVFEPTDFRDIGEEIVSMSDNFRFVFASGAEIRCLGTVTHKFFAQPAGKPKW